MRYSNSLGGGAVVLATLFFSAAAIPADPVAKTPDFTGVWTTGGGGAPAGGGAARAGGPAAGGGAAPARAGGPPPGGAAPARAGGPAPGGAPPARAGAPAAGGGARGGGAALPFTPYAKARVDAFQKLTAGTDDSPGKWCVGTGMPGSMIGSGGYPMEILQRPEEIIIVYEAHAEIRRIYLGSRNAPQEDRVPGRSGYSSGRWEGDTLVVETDNLVDQLDQRYPHSDEATIVERYRLGPNDAQGRRTLIAEMTMTDPKFYTEPVKATKTWAEVPNGRVLPYDCPEEAWLDRIAEMAKKAGVPVP
jgi:hypothetical protein